jgi:hypothetical protein
MGAVEVTASIFTLGYHALAISEWQYKPQPVPRKWDWLFFKQEQFICSPRRSGNYLVRNYRFITHEI